MKRITLETPLGIKSGYALKDRTGVWIHFEGKTSFYENQDGSKRRGKKANASKDQIDSPMPGKILKVPAVVGANVKPGDPLVVMEAMKMEYTLKSDIFGTVKAVKVKEGDQVTRGALLVSLEEKK
jgi:biotin carboxyl carrier protein